jgi:hypothetical protein
MYLFYAKEIHKNINYLKQNIGSLTFRKNNVLRKLELNELHVKGLLNVNIEDLKDITDLNTLTFNSAYKKTLEVVAFDFIKLQLTKLIHINVKLKDFIDKLKAIKTVEVTYKEYSFLVREFNLAIVDKIIQGYIFNMGYGISSISIKIKKRHKARINWNESNKLKQAILDRGGVPYNKEVSPEGEKWKVYYTEDTYPYIYWNKLTCSIENNRYYCFDPVTGNYSMVTKVYQYINSNPFAKILYDK